LNSQWLQQHRYIEACCFFPCFGSNKAERLLEDEGSGAEKEEEAKNYRWKLLKRIQMKYLCDWKVTERREEPKTTRRDLSVVALNSWKPSKFRPPHLRILGMVEKNFPIEWKLAALEKTVVWVCSFIAMST
jgi:hypothetical protein